MIIILIIYILLKNIKKFDHRKEYIKGIQRYTAKKTNFANNCWPQIPCYYGLYIYGFNLIYRFEIYVRLFV